jgi:hypothetical protein
VELTNPSHRNGIVHSFQSAIWRWACFIGTRPQRRDAFRTQLVLVELMYRVLGNNCRDGRLSAARDAVLSTNVDVKHMRVGLRGVHGVRIVRGWDAGRNWGNPEAKTARFRDVGNAITEAEDVSSREHIATAAECATHDRYIGQFRERQYDGGPKRQLR